MPFTTFKFTKQQAGPKRIKFEIQKMLQMSNTETDNYSLLEAVADLAFFAGQKGYYSGDSRGDMALLIHLAKMFEAKHEGIEWGIDLDYIETMEQYCSEVFDLSYFNQL